MPFVSTVMVHAKRMPTYTVRVSHTPNGIVAEMYDQNDVLIGSEKFNDINLYSAYYEFMDRYGFYVKTAKTTNSEKIRKKN